MRVLGKLFQSKHLFKELTDCIILYIFLNISLKSFVHAFEVRASRMPRSESNFLSGTCIHIPVAVEEQ